MPSHAGGIRSQQPHRLTASRPSCPPRVACPTPRQQRTHYRRHLHSRPQHSLQVASLVCTAHKAAVPVGRTRCTQQQAKQALAQSASLCSQMLVEALAPKGRLKRFHRDGWARPWTPGAAMFACMLVHEAHHRGQVCMLAHQFGFPLPDKATYEMWCWEKLWKQCGFGFPK